MKIKNAQKPSVFGMPKFKKNFVHFYEIGKWQGDRIGFPRVGLVNKEVKLIKDNFEFLKSIVNEERITAEIQRRSCEINIENEKQRLSESLKIPTQEILVTDNKHIKGNYIFRVFTQSRVLFREFQETADNIYKNSNEEIAQFLAGLADAEATIDTRNQIISFSLSNKKPKEAEKIKALLEKVLKISARIRTAGKIELKIEISRNDFDKFKSNIGKSMKHPEKLQRLENNFVSQKDKKYLEFIKSNPNIEAKNLANQFNIHEDSARRFLRQFRRQSLI